MQDFQRRDVKRGAVLLAAALSACNPSEPEIMARNVNIINAAGKAAALAGSVSLATQDFRTAVQEALSREDLVSVVEIAKRAETDTKLLTEQLGKLIQTATEAQSRQERR